MRCRRRQKKKKRKKRKKAGTESSKESSLRDWFGRKGAKGKKTGTSPNKVEQISAATSKPVSGSAGCGAAADRITASPGPADASDDPFKGQGRRL